MPAKTNKKKSTPAVKIHSVAKSGDDDVDRIREIIFGRQMRDYSDRFDRLESRLTAETQRLFSESEKRFKELHATLTERLDGITAEFRQESSRRDAENEDVRKSLQETRNDMNDSIGDANDRLATEVDRISALLDNTEQGLRAAQDEFGTYIKKQLKALRSEKTESSELSSLFGELASRLSGKEKS